MLKTDSPAASTASTAPDDVVVPEVPPQLPTDDNATTPTTPNSSKKKKGGKTATADIEYQYIPLSSYQKYLNGGRNGQLLKLHRDSFEWKDGSVFCRACVYRFCEARKMTDHAMSTRHLRKLAEWMQMHSHPEGVGGGGIYSENVAVGDEGVEQIEQIEGVQAMDHINHIIGQTQMISHGGATAPTANHHDLHTTAQFEIYVSKDTFKFNASHFVAYPGFRERLHGHNYRAAVRLIGGRTVGGDGYVLDFGCVKEAVKDACKGMNEYFLVPMLSNVLDITVDVSLGGSVNIVTEDGSKFVFPKEDCLLLPIMHTTAEELAVYLYGKILAQLDANYMRERGVTVMEVTVSEAVGQDAVFRQSIPTSGTGEWNFDVAAYVSKKLIPVMTCATDTEGTKRRRTNV